MPRYNCLDTEVQLFTWIPSVSAPTSRNCGYSKKQTQAYTKGPASSPGSVISSNKPNNRGEVVQYDTDKYCEAIRLSEEYFNGHKGVDLLDWDMPFYLIRAGRDLWDSTPLRPHGTKIADVLDGDYKAFGRYSTGSTLGSPHFRHAQDTPNSRSAVKPSTLFKSGPINTPSIIDSRLSATLSAAYLPEWPDKESDLGSGDELVCKSK